MKQSGIKGLELIIGGVAVIVGISITAFSDYINSGLEPSFLPVFIGIIIMINGIAFANAGHDSNILIYGAHWKRGIIRGILLSILALAYGKLDLAISFWLFVYMAASFWIAFDIFINVFKDMHWLYIGTQSYVDKAAWYISDKISVKITFRKIKGGAIFLAFKIMILMVSVIAIQNQLK